MALEQVVDEVAQSAQRQAEQILQNARDEAAAHIAKAKQAVADYAAKRGQAAQADAAQAHDQIISHAEFEARKHVLTTESGLRAQLRARVLHAFEDLDPAARKKHLETLAARAREVIPAGKVWGAAADEAVLSGLDGYSFEGAVDIAGGMIVESDTGDVRLDLSYETLLDGMWRDVLRQEAELFS